MSVGVPAEKAREAAAIWDRLGSWWDQQSEGAEGSRLHREMVGPAAEALIDVRPGERVVDVACGNGQFSRRLASLGAHVAAVDVSASFIERAQAHSTEHADRMTFHVADATDEAQMRRLGAGAFDAAVGNMAVAAVEDVDALFRNVLQLLRPGGRFVLTAYHPCFGYPFVAGTNSAHPGGSKGTSSGSRRASGLGPRLRHLAGALRGRLMRWGKRLAPPRLRTRVGRLRRAYAGAQQALHYLEATPRLRVASPRQPVAHWVFHRPLQDLLGAAFAAGFVVDGLLEPACSREPGRPEVLAVRLRVPLVRDPGSDTR